MKGRSLPIFFTIYFFVFANFTLIQADVVPGRWEKVDSQVAGTPLVFILKSGERIGGVFKKSEADSLTVAEAGVSERRILKADIGRVESSQRVTSVKHDTLVGMVCGFAPAAVFGVLIGRAFENTTAGVVLFGGIGAGIGAAVGYAVGKATQERIEVLYIAK